MENNIGSNFFLDNLNFDLAPQAQQSVVAVKPIRGKVKIGSNEFEEFINEVYINSNGVCRFNNKRPNTYDICLT
jgi:hypothetical protein